jgi:hypothetical protein
VSDTVTYEYEVVLRVLHTEPVNPDMPSLNPHALAQAIAQVSTDAGDGINVTTKSTRLVGEVR